MSRRFDRIMAGPNADDDPREFAVLGRELERENRPELAASAWDKAYGLAPDNTEIAEARNRLLDQLAIEFRGVPFRYVPAGTFLMGSESGDADERPVHPVTLDAFWMMEVPVSWGLWCEIMDWEPPPSATPRDPDGYFAELVNEIGPDAPTLGDRSAEASQFFYLREASKIRFQYSFDGGPEELAWDEEATFERTPMVSVSWHECRLFCRAMELDGHQTMLPTEAEWERAARGGLRSARWPWGNETPDEERCDCDRLDKPTGEPGDRPWFGIRPFRSCPPNGYGLYAMSGTVWEWTADRYDACYYADSPQENPVGPDRGDHRVLRGGSWTDCPEATTVSFRMSLRTEPTERWGDHFNPNIGYRVVLKRT